MENSWQKEYEPVKEPNRVIKMRGNLALVASYSNGNGLIMSAKKRFVWPTASYVGSSKVVTKRVWGKEL